MTELQKPFKTSFAQATFFNKYALDKNDTWAALAERVVYDVMGGPVEKGRRLTAPTFVQREMADKIREMKFLPGGRYLRYAGRPLHYWNNCFLLNCEDDTREEWGSLMKRVADCLMAGGGIGVNYSALRPRGSLLKRTGGTASGPLPLMYAVNEFGRNVMQGGSRRSAIYASLHWWHPDVQEFLKSKNWSDIKVYDGKSLADVKRENFNFPAPLDMTNISVCYDDNWKLDLINNYKTPEEIGARDIFTNNVRQALMTGEPGFSFNFGTQEKDYLRNACCEITSADDSDVCNLGSINLGAIETLEEFRAVVELGTQFLLWGTTRADLPYQKVYDVREKNRRLGLGLMGLHEWLLRRGKKYEVDDELRSWLAVYQDVSRQVANEGADRLSISRPVACRAIAPTGSIGILASTTTGIEPLISVAYKRRYLTDGHRWKYQYVVDATADSLIQTLGVNPDRIETAYSLAGSYERRIKFQADVQDYVDMAISSTINLPEWGTPMNNEDGVADFAATLAKYAPRLRGFTCYPNGARGGQPLTEVPYEEAKKHDGVVFDELDICEISGKGGTCGV